MWTQINENRWKRSDGAIVAYNPHSPHPNPMNLKSRMWSAYEPDPSDCALMMRRDVLGLLMENRGFLGFLDAGILLKRR